MTAALRFSHPSGQIALALAAFMSRPLEALFPAARSAVLSGAGGRDLTALASSGFARGALESYAAQQVGAAGIAIAPETLGALRSNADLQSGLRMALAPDGALGAVRRKLVAAICRDQIRGAMMKSDKAAIAGLLGAELEDFAVREAAVFVPSLSGLAEFAGTVLRAEDGAAFDVHPARDFADRVISAALHRRAPLAGTVYDVRRGLGVRAGSEPAIALSDAQARDISVLMETVAGA